MIEIDRILCLSTWKCNKVTEIMHMNASEGKEETSEESKNQHQSAEGVNDPQPGELTAAEQLDVYFHNSLDLLCIADLRGKLLRVNLQWEYLLGYSTAELIGSNFMDLVHPDDVQDTLNAISTLEQQELVLNFENRYRAKDGSYRWLEWRSRPQGKLIHAAARDVTKRKQFETQLEAARAALARERDFLNAIVEATAAGVWDWDLEGKHGYLSPKFISGLGYDPEQVGRDPDGWQRMVHPEDLPKVKAKLQAHFDSRGKEPFKHFTRFVAKSGGVLYGVCSGKVISWSPDGKPLRMVGCHVDLTELHQTKQELARTNLLLEQTNEVAQVGGWEFNLEDESLWWSDVTRAIHEVDLEYTPTLEAGINFYKEGEDRKTMREVFSRCVDTGVPFDVELQIVTAMGNTRWVRAVATPVLEKGRCVRVYGAFLDIDDAKRAQLQLEREKEKFEKVYQAAPMGITMVDYDSGRFLDCNEALLKASGYTRVELKSLTIWDVTPEKYHEVEQEQYRLLETTGRFGPYRKAFRGKDGNCYPVWAEGFLIQGPDGQQVIWSILQKICEICEK